MPVSGANRVRHGCITTLVSLLIGTHCGLLAAEPTVPKSALTRPRIALALSGGGARGIAHVGVLKVLDEMRIPIDCITGTSMGSIVGGTFAAGRTPAELEKIVLAANWQEIFRDKPPRDEISIRRKSEDYMTLFAPEYGVKNGSLALPKGVIAGVSIEAFFRQLAEPAVGVDNFDKLPIPFEAMATYIENGESVVLDHGSLSQAMRASMAVPGAIAPVEIDGKLLVDGGIANNLPIDQARKLCGDVVIAVNISTPPLKRDQITSALSVAAQLINFLGKQTVDQQLKSLGSGDVLIEPDLGDISAASFENSKEAIRIGEAATRAVAPALARYSLPPEQYAALRATQVAQEKPLGSVDEIRFAGLDRTNPEVLRALVKSKPGEPLEEEKVGADLRRIYGRGDFESIEYHIEDGAGPRAMVITPHEKSWGPDYLRFGLGLETDFQGDNEFNVLVRYRKSWLNRLGAEWITEAQVGQDTHLYTEFFQPLHEAGVWFGSVYGKVGQQTHGLFVGDDKVADYRVGYAGGGLDVGAILGTTGTLRVGPVWNQVKAEVETGDPFLPTISELTAGGRVGLVLDQFDHAWFPRAGYRAIASYYGATESLGSALNYQRVEGTLSYVKSFGPHTLNLAAAGGTDFATDMPAYESFWLGGPLRLSGFRVGQFTGREYFFGRAMYYNRVLPLPDLLGSGLYLGGSAEIGRIVDRVDGLDSPGTLYSGSVFLGADTFIGPAYLGVGAGSGGSYSVYLLIGAP
jgi:NTE family protein